MAYPSEQPAGQSQPFAGPAREEQPFAGPAGPAGPPREDWRQWFQLQGSSRPWRRSVAAGAGAAAAIAVLGVLFGLLWAWLAPTVPVVKLADGSIVVTDPSPEQYIAADGWFTLLGLGFGLIVTVGAWLALRRDRGPFLLFGVIGGALVAGRWVAPLVGEFLGRGAYQDWRETAAQGATYLAPPELQSLGPKLVPAFIAAIVLTLLAGWSNDPDLDLPGAHPGYAANHGYPPYPPQAGEYAPYMPQAGEPSPYAPPTGDPYAPPTGDPYAPAGERSPFAPPAGVGDVVTHQRPEAGPGQPYGDAEQKEPRHPA